MSVEIEDGKLIEALKKLADNRDMMITAYSVLRDNCIRNGRIVDSIEALFSIIVITMTFYDYSADHVGHLLQYTIVCIAMVTLLMSILKQKWDFGGSAEKYRLAAERCYEAKSLLRSEINKKECGEQSEDYSFIIDRVDMICRGIEPIPEKKFNRLKYKHLKTVGFSKYLSDHDRQCWIVSVIRFNLFHKG